HLRVGTAVGPEPTDASDDGLLMDVQARTAGVEDLHRNGSSRRRAAGGPRLSQHAALGAPRVRGRQVRVRAEAPTRLFAALEAPSGRRPRPGVVCAKPRIPPG